MTWQDVVGGVLIASFYGLILFVVLKAIRLAYTSASQIKNLERKVARLQQEVDNISISKSSKKG